MKEFLCQKLEMDMYPKFLNLRTEVNFKVIIILKYNSF